MDDLEESSYTSNTTSAFIGKLWRMIDDEKTDKIITWNKSGRSFLIKNPVEMAYEVLPEYYKHKNISSFIRQLNMYGFRKVTSISSGSLKNLDDNLEFSHPYFIRGHPELLCQIKRKSLNFSSKEPSVSHPKEKVKRPVEVKKKTPEDLVADMEVMKQSYDAMRVNLNRVMRENDILWKELSRMRHKQITQQSVVNKLIRFLLSLAQPTSHGLVKRRLQPLMIKDSTARTKPKNGKFKAAKGPIIHEIQCNDQVEIEAPVINESDLHDGQLYEEIVVTPEIEIRSENEETSSLMHNNNYDESDDATSSDGSSIPSPKTNTERAFLSLIKEVIRDQEPLDPMVTDANSYDMFVRQCTNRKSPANEKSISPPTFNVNVIEDDNSKPDSVKMTVNMQNVKKTSKKPDVSTTTSFAKHRLKKKHVKMPSEEKQSLTVDEATDSISDLGQLIQDSIMTSPMAEFALNDGNKGKSPLLEMDSLLKQHEEISNVNPTLSVNYEGDALQNGMQGLNVNSNDMETTGAMDANQFLNQLYDPNEITYQEYDSSNIFGNSDEMAVACTDVASNNSNNSADSIGYTGDERAKHQAEYETLRDMMQNEGISIDVNTLLQLLDEDPMRYKMPPCQSVDNDGLANDDHNSNQQQGGNGVVSLVPPVMDLSDILGSYDWNTSTSGNNTPINDWSTDSYINLDTPIIEPRDPSPTTDSPACKKLKKK